MVYEQVWRTKLTSTGIRFSALVQDEGLKRLLMSWYYAGYYTGLWEGEQKHRNEQQHQQQHQQQQQEAAEGATV